MPGDPLESLLSFAENWGYPGAFIISVLGNLIPFMPIPYLAAIFIMAANLPDVNPALLGVISGLGGGVGKVLVYLASMGVSDALKPISEKRLEALKRLIGDYGALAAFLIAATPSPDDIVVIILGMIKYDLTKYFIAITSGKIVISLAVAYTGRAFQRIMGTSDPALTAIASIVFLIVSVAVIAAIDWVRVLEIVEENGWREVVRILVSGNIREILVERLRNTGK